jgi:hypothetical protein
MRKLMTAAVLAVATALALPPTLAQHHGAGEPAAGSLHAPRLGDIMILQQIRHSKLWFAAAANNWDLADHELYGLKDAFGDMAKLYPTIGNVTVGPVISALAEGELAELGKAIEVQDRFKFTVAFGKLTAACNACHQSTRHAFIVIQQPISPPFNNQSFAPTPQDPSDPAHRH